MGNQLSWTYLPDSNLAFHTARTNELAIKWKANSSDSTFVCIVNLPKLLAVINPISTNSSVTPSTEDDFIGENGTIGEDSTLSLSYGTWRSNASCNYCVVVRVPESHCTVFWWRYESVVCLLIEPNTQNRWSMVFAQQHLWKIIISNSVNVPPISCHKALQTIRTNTQPMNGSKDLNFLLLFCVLAICLEQSNLTISTSNYDFITWNGLDCFHSHRTNVHG